MLLDIVEFLSRTGSEDVEIARSPGRVRERQPWWWLFQGSPRG
ncbi:hypothetical protein AB0G54_40995 [Streptomyces yokosukanensis]|nr:hypothetical protein [Streptomyces yokosukanensis]